MAARLDLGNVIGPPGSRGRWIHSVTEDVTAPPVDAVLGDFILNVSGETIRIGNLNAVDPGALCAIIVMEPFTVRVEGTLRGGIGPVGTQIFSITTNVIGRETLPTGARVGDLLLVASPNVTRVGDHDSPGINLFLGDIKMINTIPSSDGAGISVAGRGNIRGPEAMLSNADVHPPAGRNLMELGLGNTPADVLRTLRARPRANRFDGIRIGDYFLLSLQPTSIVPPGAAGGYDTAYLDNCYVDIVGMNVYNGATVFDPSSQDCLLFQFRNSVGLGAINTTNTTVGGWRDCAARAWLNSQLRTMLANPGRPFAPSNAGETDFLFETARSILMPSGTATVFDALWLPTEYEVSGRYVWSAPKLPDASGNANTIELQFPAYQNSIVRRAQKRSGGNGSTINWWSGSNSLSGAGWIVFTGAGRVDVYEPQLHAAYVPCFQLDVSG